MTQLFAWGGQSTGVSALASFLPKKSQGWSPSEWTGWISLQGTLKSLLQHHSSKASILRCSAFFTVQLSHPYMTTGKTIVLTRWGLYRTIQFQLLQHYWLGHRLGLLWYWMVCLRNEQRSFCRFWDCIQVLHFRLFCWPWWPLHFFWGIPACSSRSNGHLN